ncbi:hypothetical protein RCC30_05525 [Pseudomonas fluorescens]|nr:hypothetical protein RCC30_05525 [Pseudomonas fluorescens]
MAGFFRTLFGFTPMGMLINNWGPVSGFFAALWDVLKALAAPVIDFYATLFAYSPQALILKNWQPLVGLFASIWDLLRAVSVPVAAFFATLWITSNCRSLRCMPLSASNWAGRLWRCSFRPGTL